MKDYSRLKKLAIISAIATLMGQVYINPFNSSFRFSIGVACLTFLILWFDKLSIIRITSMTAIFIYVFRTSLEVMRYGYIDTIFRTHLPAVGFYIAMGIILTKVNIRRYKDQPVVLIFLVGMTDVLSNVIEMIIRNEFYIEMVEIIVNKLLIIGFGRALLAFFLYLLVRTFNILIIQEEHQKRYRELLLFTANMKAEIFFLNKNTQLIEKAMEESFSIYQYLKDCDEGVLAIDEISRLRDKALNLSKDIHEIKKDNKRVVMGVEKLLPSTKIDKDMPLDSIFNIINDNTTRSIDYMDKDIKLEFVLNDKIDVKNYYSLITIINNLVNNSIRAIKNSGYIWVIQTMDNDDVMFEITDNGCGILEKNLCVIFEPGFSTIFNRETGNMSTGIGLTHVRNIVNNQFGGSIDVQSTKEVGTSFFIRIPKANL